jgi:Protein of unknown function (DUF2867)
MPRISPPEFLAQSLRVHAFLAGVALHDVWAVDLPPIRKAITLQEFRRRAKRNDGTGQLTRPARLLFRLRILIGRVLGWDSGRSETPKELFAERLTPRDCARSAVPAGTQEGMLRVVYSFENEQLVELRNRTVHAAALSALVERSQSYRFYLAVYVRKRGWITPVYMSLIDPFRRWVVYPALLRQIESAWTRAFGSDAAGW